MERFRGECRNSETRERCFFFNLFFITVSLFTHTFIILVVLALALALEWETGRRNNNTVVILDFSTNSKS